ncbi:MAG: hypothetical protein KDE27_30375 [Planctomycetes bacterium]|nr:hypothetical protein [Planctomycetota bacterium]
MPRRTSFGLAAAFALGRVPGPACRNASLHGTAIPGTIGIHLPTAISFAGLTLPTTGHDLRPTSSPFREPRRSSV